MRWQIYGALVLVQIVFGVHYFVTKLLLESIPPRAWAVLRICGAAILLMGWNLAFLRSHPRRLRDLGSLALFALFGVVINQILFVEGLARTTPSHSSIINSLIPVLTLCFALLLGRESPSWKRSLAILVSFVSVMVLLQVEDLNFSETWVIGDLLTLANAASFSFFLVISKRYLQRHHPLGATAWLLCIGALGIAGVGGKTLGQVDLTQLPWEFWALGLYAVVFATVLAYLMNWYALRHVDSSMVALFIYLQAPIATSLSVAFLGEQLTLRFVLASAGIFLGVFFAVAGSVRRQSPEVVRDDTTKRVPPPEPD